MTLMTISILIVSISEIRQTAAMREFPERPPEFRDWTSWVGGQLALAFGLFALIAAVVFGTEFLHWLTGGWVPQLMDWTGR